jgi:hypothetical protein
MATVSAVEIGNAGLWLRDYKSCIIAASDLARNKPRPHSLCILAQDVREIEMNDQRPTVPPADDRVVTAQEAIEPLFHSLELEAEAKLLAAAGAAGWSAQDAIEAIDQLRRKDILSALADGDRSE